MVATCPASRIGRVSPTIFSPPHIGSGIPQTSRYRTTISDRLTLVPAALTSTVGIPGDREMISGPSGVAMMVSSDLVPVMEGFQAKAWELLEKALAVMEAQPGPPPPGGLPPRRVGKPGAAG
jgi:hypothetical protein